MKRNIYMIFLMLSVVMVLIGMPVISTAEINSGEIVAYADEEYRFVEPGGNTTLTVISDPSISDILSYEWSKSTYYEDDDGWRHTNLEEYEGLSSITVPNRTSEYYCRVSDQYGKTTDVYFSLIADNGFSVNAVDQFVSVKHGGNATLSVNAHADKGTISYKWSHEGDVLDYPTSTDSISIENIEKATEYFCSVCDQFGNASSISFEITVGNGFEVKAENRHITVKPGGDAILSVDAKVNTGDLTYKWLYYSRENFLEPVFTNTSSVKLENITHNERYSCEVIDQYGNSEEIEFEICVDNGFAVDNREKNIPVKVGEDVTLSADARVNEGSITYEWYRNMDRDVHFVPEELNYPTNTTSIVIEDVKKPEMYYCKVNDIYGNSEIIIFNLRTNGIQAKAVNNKVIIEAGGSATLSVDASADNGSLRYHWIMGVQDDLDYPSTASSITLKDVRKSDLFTCIVSDDYGNKLPVSFDVIVDNGFPTWPEDVFLTVKNGESITLDATVNVDHGNVNYFWDKESYCDVLKRCESSDRIENGNNPALKLDNITEKAVYSCFITDEYSNYRRIIFHIGIENGFSISGGDETIEVEPGENATMNVTASVRDGSLSYRWEKYDSPDSERYFDYEMWDNEIPSFRDKRTVTLENVTEPTVYECIVYDEYGNIARKLFRVKIKEQSSEPSGSGPSGSGSGSGAGGGGGSASANDDTTVAAKVSKAIVNLPNNITVSDKKAIEEVRESYNSLTAEQKALIPSDIISKLEAAEAALKSAEKIKLTEDSIDALPEACNITIKDKESVESAIAAFESLTDDEKASLDSVKKNKLDEVTAALNAAELKEASYINKLTVNRSDIKKASYLGATSIVLGPKVKKLNNGIFKNTSITRITIKTRKLTKAKVKSSLKGSKIKTIKVAVGNKNANKKYLKKYRKIFTKINAGRKVKLS